MWPQHLPREVREHPFRKAEVKVYERLQRELDDEYVVFYSRPWLGLTATGEEIDGECDFLVAHPGKGMLALEVKGGGISFDPASDTWFTTNRYGVKARIKNPVAQARSAKHNLLKALKEGRRLGGQFVRARHGVLFPDCETLPRAALAPDMPAAIFCCEQRFEHDLARWIDERMGSMDDDDRGRSGELGLVGIRALEYLLATPFALRIPLSKRLREAVEEVEVLTQQQAFILRGMAGMPRVAIAGAAGSGKTVLSIQEALRLADNGLRVNWICYNAPLAAHVRELVGERDNLRIASFHELCGSLAKAAGLRLDAAKDPSAFFEEVLPETAIAALDMRPDMGAAAVVVDEGQDFLPLWWTVVDAILEAGRGSTLRIFHDTNQTLYHDRRIPGDVPSEFVLVRNLRNTQQIFKEAKHLYRLPRGQAVEAAGPEGVPVVRVPVPAGADLASAVAQEVNSLVARDGLATGEIAVLAADQATVDRIRDKIKTPPRAHAEDNAPLVIDTVRRFKGLERPAVVIAVDPAFAAQIELSYVAFSRASALLVLVGLAECLAAVAPPHARD